MPPFLREHLVPMGWATALHAGLLVMLTISFALQRTPVVPPHISIKATVIDEGAIRARQERAQEAERAAQRERDQALAAKRRAAELEQQRLDQLRVEQEQAARAAQERRLSEERKVAQERKRQAEAEQQRKEAAAAEERRQQEQARKQEAERVAAQKREAERKAEEKRQAEAAAKRQAELQAELAGALAAEEDIRNSGMREQYAALIQQRVTRNWIRPPEARAGLRCELFVTQIPGGEVVAVRFGACDAGDTVKRSIEAAVFKASPLPRPPDPALFERNLVLDFRPD
ncbi:MAG: TonB C-terminal domain-containing protein [Gammaproteobacteria bacterium]